jgi:hypothetical protein
MKMTLTAIIMTTMLLTYTLPVSANDYGWQRLISFFSDNDEHDDDYHSNQNDEDSVTPVNNDNYRQECGSCHFAYQPGLLPARSWQKLMGNLQNHFGDNAELEAQAQQTLTDYLVKNAADFSPDKFSIQLVRRLSKKLTPLRTTELPYFRHEHDEIPTGMVKDNPKVKSFSNCDKCHTGADKGDYSEENISISGYGGWED